MCIPELLRRGRRSAGVSLVELVVFIVIVSVAVTGVLVALNTGSRNTADPMIRKQALAIAEGLLEEVELMSFTYCDGYDANAATATGAFVGAGGCAAKVQGLGPDAGETRYNAPAFENVADYNGFNTATAVPAGIADIASNVNPALAGYNAQVAVAQQAVAGIPAAAMLHVTVTVTHAGTNTTVVLDGYRAQYAPNTVN